jgi:hypothetical protein
MSRIEKCYWENPDDPSDNGYAYPCMMCGEHGETQKWADDHKCTPFDDFDDDEFRITAAVNRLAIS